MRLQHFTSSLILLLGLPLLVLAQPKNNLIKDVAMPAPNAASLGKFGDIPVSYFTGVPNVSVPVYTVQEGSLSLPITMSYHAGGIKVGEPVSWVGTGWSLSAGGMISRTVLGRPDDVPRGYFERANSLVAPMQSGNLLSTMQMDSVAKGSLDSEPDFFNFSVGGYSGKFVFDKDKQVNFIPKADLTLSYVLANGSYGNIIRFVITTPDGVRYIFGTLDTEANTSKSGIETTLYDNISPFDLGPTGWYLRKIESHDKKFSITLNYVDENYSYKSLSSCTVQYYQGTGSGNTTGNITSDCGPIPVGTNKAVSNSNMQGKRLSQIVSSTAIVNFIATTDRQDLDPLGGSTTLPKLLDRIEVVNPVTSGCNQKMEFFYGYFQSPGGTTSPYKRLRLDSLRERSCDNILTKPAYKFTYAAGNIPDRYSKAIDHWGYANGVSTNEITYGIPPLSVTWQGSTVTPPFATANRETSEISMMAGVLQRIDYPTGGNTQFTYEGNRITEYTSTPSSIIVMPDLSNCTFPQANCCTITQSTTTRTFSTRDLTQAKFSLRMINTSNNYQNPNTNYLYCAVSGGYANPNPPSPQVIITVTQTSNNAAVGVYSYNMLPTLGSQEVIQPVGQLNLLPNINYTFKIEAYFGKGSFSIYRDTVVQGTAQDKIVGGLRIKTIRHNDCISTANDIVKNYRYVQDNNSTVSSGLLYFKPTYYGYQYDVLGAPKGLVFNATSVVPLGGPQGYHIGYSRVEEETVGAGKAVYYFSQEFPYTNTNTYPSPPVEAQVRDGQQTLSQSFDQSSVLVSENRVTPTSETYYYLPGIIYKAYSFPCTYNQPTPCLYAFTYRIRTAPYRIGQKTETIDGVTTTTNFQYDTQNRFLAPVGTNITNSDAKVVTTNYKYPHDMATGALRTELLNRNLIATPIETTVSVGATVVSGSRTDYSFYDASGNPTASNGTGVHPYPYQFSNYEMTFNGSTPVAGSWVLKGTINNVEAASGLPRNFTTANWPTESYTWLNGLIKTRTYQNFVWTYNYNPGTRQVSSIKNMDGVVTNYTYDQLQRLKTVSARGGNVVTTYSYNYKGGANPYNNVRSSTAFTATTNSQLVLKETVQHLDGLGRMIEQVNVKNNPSKGADGTLYGTVDVAVAYTYDAQGRLSTTTQPFQSPNMTGAYYPVPANTPYTLTQYESSPLSRPISVTPPGWYATTTSYGTNTSTITPPGSTTSYPAGTLMMTKITDPDNRVSIAYKDRRGRLVMTRKTDTGNTTPADTYTEYDDKDRVVRVIPPGATATTPDLLFTYTYDAVDRMTSKKIPGADLVNLRYNNRDQLVFLQDGNLLAQAKSLATRYDIYGRPTRTGMVAGLPADPNLAFTFTDTLTRTYYDGFDGTTQLNLVANPQYLGKVRRSEALVLGSTTWLNNTLTYDTWGRVTNTAGNNLLNLTVNTAEQMAYTYDWADNKMSETRTHTPGAAGATGTRNLNYTWQYDHAGRQTVYVFGLDGDGFGTQLAEYNYNHRNEMVERNLHANQVAGVWGWLQSIDYGYNAQGWLTAINNWNPTATVNTPAQCAPAMPNPASPARTFYNDANDLMYMDIRYDQLLGISGTSGTIQKAGNISQIAWRARGRETQIYSYGYDYLSRLTTSTYYNYSDAAVVNGTNNYNENLSYDLRGNIQTLQRTGFYTNASTCTFGQIDNLTYSYTANTNRLHKVLDATVTAGDAKSRGFNGLLSTVDNSMTYDANGNLIKNLHKNVSSISYNHLNLPTVITFTTGNTIEFLYDAGGSKLRKTVKVGGVVQYVQDYIGGIEYRQTGAGVKRIESIFHAEGRYYNTNVDASNTVAWRKEYNFKDHLGNTRLVFTDRNGNGVVDITGTASTSDVLQENHYYAFGMAFEGAWLQNDASIRDNKYQYNGKEFNDDFGLNWNDYGARWYDAAIGRWNGVDAMAERMPAYSPFNYVFNSPIKNIDKFGLFPDEVPYSSSHDERTMLKEQLAQSEETVKRKDFWKKLINYASKAAPTASLVVTNETKGTAKLVDNYYKPGVKGYNSNYYNVPTFKMTLEGTDDQGNFLTGEYEVLRMGVKRDGSNSATYFQGFGAPNEPDVETTYSLGNYFEDETYTRGAFRISTHYLLHSGPSYPTALPPANGGGRINYGCIAVCGSKGSQSSWEGLLSTLKQLNGATKYSDIPVSVISITIQPYQITGTPIPQN